jgi:exosortase
MQKELKKDLVWAVLLGFLVAISPLSGAARIHISIVAGILFSVFVVIFRKFARKRAPGLLSAATDGALIARPTFSVLVLLSATLIVFLPTLHWLYEQYTRSVWTNAHGVFLPVVVVVLARSRLRAGLNAAEASSPWGIPFLMVGALLAMLDSGVHSGMLGAIGLVVALPGLALLLLGAQRTRLIAFPLVLTVFLLPLPESLPEPFWLPSGTAFMIEQYFGILGIPSIRHQTYFKLTRRIFEVSTNCSGLSAFYAASFVLLIMVSATRSWARRALILLSIWPLTVVINGARGALLIWLCNRHGREILDSPIHGITGIVTVMALFSALLVLADWREIAKANT